MKRMEDALRATTTDYIICRRDKQAAEARAAAAEELQERERASAAAKVRRLASPACSCVTGCLRMLRSFCECARGMAETKKMHGSTHSGVQMSDTKKVLEAKLERALLQGEAAAEEAAGKASKQLKAREMEASQLESMHSAVKAELEQRVEELESKLSRAKEGWKQAEHRRVLDSEGFTSDVTMLRQQLASVDRKLHQMRLQSRLEDDERLDGLLKKVQTKGKPLKEVRYAPLQRCQRFSFNALPLLRAKCMIFFA